MQHAIRISDALLLEAQGSVLVAAPARAVPPDDANALAVWRRHEAVAESEDALACGGVELPPHDSRLVAALGELLQRVDPARTGLIYVHRGHQAFYRTPLLQSLLAALPKVGAVCSFRAASTALPDEALQLAAAYLDSCSSVLVVDDGVERLRAAGRGAPGGWVRYMLLRRDGEPVRAGPWRPYDGALAPMRVLEMQPMP